MTAALEGIPGVGDVVADKYRLRAKIGAGAAGVVFEATHEVIGRVVAVKWLYPQFAMDESLSKRFLREARAACVINHPNVVDVFDAGHDRDSLYLVMERLYGEPLSKIFERRIADPSSLVAILMPALRGIAAAHEAGIVHRDLKPDNVFIAEPRRGRPGGAKVLDFGISKLREPGSARPLTHAGMMMGSPYYMAPEQIADSSTVDARADVYSIGVMLYEGLTGDVPFEAESLAKLFFRISNEQVPPIHHARQDVPAALETIIVKAMSAQPKDRFSSVAALAKALEPYAQGVTLDPGPSRESLAIRPTAVGGASGTDEELQDGPTQVSFRESEEGEGLTDPAAPALDEETDPEKDAAPLDGPPTRPGALDAEAATTPRAAALPDDSVDDKETDPRLSGPDELPKGRVDIADMRTLELNRAEALPADLVEDARRMYEAKRAEQRAEMFAKMEDTDVYPKSTARPGRSLSLVAVVGGAVVLAFLGALLFVILRG